MLMTLIVGQVNAQDQEIETSVTGKASALLKSGRLTLPPNDDAKAEISIGKDFKLGGPAVSSVKTRKVLDVPRRILKFLNPFAPTEESTAFDQKRRLSSRAWSTTVGLHPGRSAFPDATTHEPTMTLVTVGR
jgi:hypothetical protein